MIEELLDGFLIENETEVIEDEEEDYTFYNQKNDCFGIRLDKDNLHVLLNNKVVNSWSKKEFPDEMDFNNINIISKMTTLIRTKGVQALMEAFSLSQK